MTFKAKRLIASANRQFPRSAGLVPPIHHPPPPATTILPLWLITRWRCPCPPANVLATGVKRENKA